MNTEKLTRDELLLCAEMMSAYAKKYSNGSMMKNHIVRTSNKLKKLSGSDGKDDIFVVVSIPLEEATELMQDIKTNIMHGVVSESKSNVLKFVSEIWRNIFTSEKSAFERQAQ